MKNEHPYEDGRDLHSSPSHDIAGSWIVVAVLALLAVFAFRGSAPITMQASPGTLVAPAPQERVPLAQLIGMSSAPAR